MFQDFQSGKYLGLPVTNYGYGKHNYKGLKHIVNQLTFLAIFTGKPTFTAARVSVNNIIAGSTFQTRITGTVVNV